MKKQTNPRAGWSALIDIDLAGASGRPLFRRLHAALRQRILTRALPHGARLPSTRDLATRLGISRASVVAAYEQLLAEGFIEGRVGAGSFVAVDVAMQPGTAAAARDLPRATLRRVSARARRMPEPSQPDMPPGVPFETGMVQLDSRMREAWRSAVLAQATQVTAADLRYGDPAGDPELRNAVADYLRVARGMRAEADLIAALAAERRLADQQPASMLQRVVAQLMREGHFASHLRRMRQRYLGARDVLVASLRLRLGDRIEVVPPEQGIQLPAWLPRGIDDRTLARRAAAQGVAVKAISPMFLAGPRRHGLLLGYAGFDEHSIRSAVARLARAFER